MSAPLTEADLIFPHQSSTPSFSTTLSSLRRSTLSIHNRLSSIVSDSEFVASVAEAYSLPLVANERCGSWYIPPALKSSSVYFKSTDGHMGEWGFSLRRLNLQLLDVVEKWGGAVIVDSTRRGKSMPDALSKTVPIWCCVINRAVFGGGGKHELFTPPQAVSESEHAQIEKRVDGFVQQFLVGFHPLKHICEDRLTVDRISANPIFPTFAPSCKNRCVRSGLHSSLRCLCQHRHSRTSTPSSCAPRPTECAAQKHLRTGTSKALQTTTKHGRTS